MFGKATKHEGPVCTGGGAMTETKHSMAGAASTYPLFYQMTKNPTKDLAVETLEISPLTQSEGETGLKSYSQAYLTRYS